MSVRGLQLMKTTRHALGPLSKFNTEEKCIAYLERIRWPNGLECPRCKARRISKFDASGKTGKVRHLYECTDCRYQYCGDPLSRLALASHKVVSRYTHDLHFQQRRFCKAAPAGV